ncbi:hypothetical protein BRC84_01250 [Halobacteriales archaeon QS_1_68_44]|nr:MAG: hypothetical protein BRC84_01250 [Halobacteriales archaeon QS_1_68_44]
MDRTHPVGRRRLLAAGAVTLLSGLAGCNDEAEPVDPGKPRSQAPSNTGVLVGADTALFDHGGTDRLLEAYGGGRAGSDEGDDTDLVAEFENRTDLDPESADIIVVFADQPRGDFAAYVVEADWSESTVVESMEAATSLKYEARDHEGGTVYEPADNGDEADYLGVVAEGRYAIGSVGAVEAAIETVHADRDSASGPLVDAFEDAAADDAEGTTYVTAATDDPRAYLPPEDSERVPSIVSLDIYEKATVGTVAYTAAGSSVAVDAVLRAENADDAREMYEFTLTVASFLQNDIDDEAVAGELEKIDVERAESVVTISYRSDVEGAATLAAWL